jgi:hypothetical protein
MIIKIDNNWFKSVEKNDYKNYIKECNEAKEKVTFKIHEGKVVYKVVNSVELKKLNVAEEPQKEQKQIKDNPVDSLLSVVLLTTGGKTISVPKINIPVLNTSISKQVPFIIGQSLNYQYCDRCNTTVNHYKVMGVLACGNCRYGVVL